MTDSPHRTDELFERWLAGDADADAERELERAAATDPRLAAELEDFRDLIGRVAALPSEVRPERDLWRAIALRTGVRPAPVRHRVVRPLALAATAILALAVGLLIGRAVPDEPLPREQTAVAAPVALFTPSPLERTAYAATDRELTALVVELRRAIEARQRDLPPATRAILFSNLETIERAIADIEAAMRDRPADPALARTYIDYRQRQVDLLRRANVLASRL